MTYFWFFFQKFLWKSRLVILFAVIAGILSTFTMVIIGTLEVYEALKELFYILRNVNIFSLRYHYVVQHIVNSVDLYLIATVLLIFSIGLYELFIQEIDVDDKRLKKGGVLDIYNLEQLKNKLAQTIIMILIVNFFQHATHLSYTGSLELLYLGIGVFLIAVAVRFTH
jgi:uncharacterized membrane protein YqhA